MPRIGALVDRTRLHRGAARAALLFAAVLALLLLAAGYVWFTGPLRSSRDEGAPISQSATGSTKERRESLGVPSSSAPEHSPREGLGSEERPPQTTARQFIEEFLGPDAQRSIERLEAMGWDLDQLGPPQGGLEESRAKAFEFIMPNEEKLAVKRESLLRWPRQLDSEWLQEHLKVQMDFTAAQIEEIRTLASPFLEQAQPLASQFTDLLQVYVRQAWQQRRDTAFPYISFGSSNGPFCDSGGAGGWAFSLCLSWDDCPGLLDLQQEMLRIARARDEKLHEYLSHR